MFWLLAPPKGFLNPRLLGSWPVPNGLLFLCSPGKCEPPSLVLLVLLVPGMSEKAPPKVPGVFWVGNPKLVCFGSLSCCCCCELTCCCGCCCCCDSSISSNSDWLLSWWWWLRLFYTYINWPPDRGWLPRHWPGRPGEPVDPLPAGARGQPAPPGAGRGPAGWGLYVREMR